MSFELCGTEGTAFSMLHVAVITGKKLSGGNHHQGLLGAKGNKVPLPQRRWQGGRSCLPGSLLPLAHLFFLTAQLGMLFLGSWGQVFYFQGALGLAVCGCSTWFSDCNLSSPLPYSQHGICRGKSICLTLSIRVPCSIYICLTFSLTCFFFLAESCWPGP